MFQGLNAAVDIRAERERRESVTPHLWVAENATPPPLDHSITDIHWDSMILNNFKASVNTPEGDQLPEYQTKRINEYTIESVS
ncbi:hypothetical protein FRC12_003595 [Ceratobasidium sp. 428]|nr:hypothetical protein FRC12_003595 [Ceratobasidium sp. 428]